MIDDRTIVRLGPSTADESCPPATQSPAGMILTGAGTGPHRLRLLPSTVTYFPAPPASRLRPLLIAGVLLLAASLSGAVYLVGCKRPASTRVARPGDEQALQVFSEAKQLFAAGQRYAAMERVKRAQTLTTDEEILRVVGALERRLEAANQIEQARIQIKARKWRDAAFHLQKSLALHPTPEAECFFQQTN